MIGDKASDVELGRRAGSTTLLVRTGYGAEVAGAGDVTADYVVEDLREAARVIEGLIGSRRGDRRSGAKERAAWNLSLSPWPRCGRTWPRARRSSASRPTPVRRPSPRRRSVIADAFRSGGKLLICGNGGSAADCQHMAAEFVSRLTKDFERPGLPAIALTTDTLVPDRLRQRLRLRGRLRAPGAGARPAAGRADRHQHQRELRQRDPGGGARARRSACGRSP